MRATEIDQFEAKYGYKPTRAEDELRRARRLREQGQPDREADARAGRGHLQQEPQARLQAEHHDLGPARPDRRLGEPADQPLRPQLRERHLRVLQGAHAEERRLQGHRQGAAGIRVGRAGRDRGSLRHRLQRHRLPDVGRQGRAAGRDRQGPVLGRQLRGRHERQVPAVALPLHLRQQGAGPAARSAGRASS